MNKPIAEPLTTDELDLLRAAGAPACLMVVVTTDQERFGVERNSAREHVKKAVRVADDVTPDGVAASMPSGGDYVTALWNDELMEALVYADIANTTILTHQFHPEEFLCSARDLDNWSLDHAKRIVSENFEQYGPQAGEDATSLTRDEP